MSIDSNYEKKNQRIKKNLLNFTIILFLVVSNFLIGEYLREDTMTKVMWTTDDPIAISTARSYQINGDFKVHFLRAGDFSYFTTSLPDAIQSRPSISNDYNAKGPIYSILLGDFYKLLGTTPDDLYFYGSIFSNLGTSAFLVAFFFLIKKYFNLKIAFFSSLLILANSSFGWASSKVMSDSGLLFLFSVLAIFFLEKKKSHYFLFGIFTGLSHLTHPFGIFLGSAYAIYLLIHREFKGFLLTVLGWQLVLLPWFIRNYYLYRDIGWGLWIPFSAKVSYFISVVTHTENQVVGSNPISSSGISFIGSVEPFQTFIGLLIDEANNIWFISFLLIFIFFTTTFAFIKIDKLKINKKFWLLGLVGVLYVLVYYIHNAYLQIIFSFIIPIILVYLLYRNNKAIFETTLPRLYYFIIFFTFINLIYYYVSTSVVERTVPEIREVIFAIFMLTPLALFGTDKLLQKIESRLGKIIPEKSPWNHDKSSSKFAKKNVILKIMSIIMMSLLVLPIIIQMSDGLTFQHYFIRNNWPVDNDQVKATNDWINSHIYNQKIASNAPAYSYSKTGLDTIPIPTPKWSQSDTEQYFSYYDISYVVFYGANVPKNYQGELVDSYKYYDIMKWPMLFTTYSDVYTNGNSHIIKITNDISSSTINEPILYLKKGYLMELQGLKDNATEIYDQLISPTTTKTDEKLCNEFRQMGKLDYALKKCNLLLNADGKNTIAFSNIIIIYEETEEKEKVLPLLTKFQDIMMNDPKNIALIDAMDNVMNILIEHDISYEKIVTNWFDKAKMLEEKGDNKDALLIYRMAQNIDQFTISSFSSQVRVMTKLEQYDNAITTYDLMIGYIENQMQNSPKNYPILQQSLMTAYLEKATLLINLHKYEDASNAYLEIEKINMFDKNAHEQRATLLEQTGNLSDALQEYEFLNHMEPNNQEFTQKITNLNVAIKDAK